MKKIEFFVKCKCLNPFSEAGIDKATRLFLLKLSEVERFEGVSITVIPGHTLSDKTGIRFTLVMTCVSEIFHDQSTVESFIQHHKNVISEENAFEVDKIFIS